MSPSMYIIYLAAWFLHACKYFNDVNFLFVVRLYFMKQYDNAARNDLFI